MWRDRDRGGGCRGRTRHLPCVPARYGCRMPRVGAGVRQGARVPSQAAARARACLLYTGKARQADCEAWRVLALTNREMELLMRLPDLKKTLGQQLEVSAAHLDALDSRRLPERTPAASGR